MRDDNLTRGRLTLSLDFELGWGTLENNRWRRRERAGVYERLRPAMRSFLSLLDDLEIAVTWATVGAMVCKPEDMDFDHVPAVQREAVGRFLSGAHPTTRDGRDLLEMMLGARVRHDIGSHSFSHTRFGTTGFDLEARRTDLYRARTILRQWGCTPQSFVFPENDAPSLAGLADADIRLARLAPMASRTSRLTRLRTLAAPPPGTLTVAADEGPATEAGSMLFHWPPSGRGHRLRRAVTLLRAFRGLRRAARGGPAVHYWLHPFNLAENHDLHRSLARLLREAAAHRDAGRLRIIPMSGITAALSG